MNLFEKTSSHWVRYDKYEWREDDKGRLYITPTEKSKTRTAGKANDCMGFPFIIVGNTDDVQFHADRPEILHESL